MATDALVRRRRAGGEEQGRAAWQLTRSCSGGGQVEKSKAARLQGAAHAVAAMPATRAATAQRVDEPGKDGAAGSGKAAGKGPAGPRKRRDGGEVTEALGGGSGKAAGKGPAGPRKRRDGGEVTEALGRDAVRGAGQDETRGGGHQAMQAAIPVKTAYTSSITSASTEFRMRAAAEIKGSLPLSAVLSGYRKAYEHVHNATEERIHRVLHASKPLASIQEQCARWVRAKPSAGPSSRPKILVQHFLEYWDEHVNEPVKQDKDVAFFIDTCLRAPSSVQEADQFLKRREIV